MLLLNKETGTLVEILEIQKLIDPNDHLVQGQGQAGEEEQDPEAFEKAKLIFPSGESLPRCWVDANYKNAKSA